MTTFNIVMAILALLAIWAAWHYCQGMREQAAESGRDSGRMDLLTLNSWQLVPDGAGRWAVLAYQGAQWGVLTTAADPRVAIDMAFAKVQSNG